MAPIGATPPPSARRAPAPPRALGSAVPAPVAQWIEHWFPKPCAQVRFLPGASLGQPAKRLFLWPARADRHRICSLVLFFRGHSPGIIEQGSASSGGRPASGLPADFAPRARRLGQPRTQDLFDRRASGRHTRGARAAVSRTTRKSPCPLCFGGRQRHLLTGGSELLLSLSSRSSARLLCLMSRRQPTASPALAGRPSIST